MGGGGSGGGGGALREDRRGDGEGGGAINGAEKRRRVIHSARANATHNHGLDADRLLVAEAFVGKGVYFKQVSYHAKGRSGIMERPQCRLTVVVRETTPEEEAKIAKLRVSNFKKLTRQERQLMPHKLIETTPKWSRRRKQAATAA
ncbi:uncharacterized protein LOC141837574 [Curcuma longa]|uniref:uncharacterized protein LOC141837574 n=1 Tax=Curcuma longa TaxID=136217 RepID=UPI003D9E42BF